MAFVPYVFVLFKAQVRQVAFEFGQAAMPIPLIYSLLVCVCAFASTLQ
jgi:hypothetical protein